MKSNRRSGDDTLADVAGFGSGLVREPDMQVDYEVHFLEDKPGYLGEYLGQFSSTESLVEWATHPSIEQPTLTSTPSLFTEALCAASNGLGLMIGTRTRGTARTIRDIAESGFQEMTVDWSTDMKHATFRSTAKPNPTFIYDAATEFEAIVVVDPNAVRPHYGHAQAIKEAIREVSYITSKILNAPLMSVQCPVQLPPRRYLGDDVVASREEQPSRPSALAIRFSVAFKANTAASRLELIEHLLEFCASMGFGLWVADSRPGRRSGNWFTMLQSDPKKAKEGREQRYPLSRDEKVHLVIPAAVVGPARTGSMFAIASVLCQYWQLGIVGCSLISFDELVFMYFQVAVRGEANERLRAADFRALYEKRDKYSPSAVLERLLPRVLAPGEHISDNYHMKELVEKTWDFRTFLGQPTECKFDPGRRFSVWFSWETNRAGEGLGAAVGTLASAGREIVQKFCPSLVGTGVMNVEYVICRQVSLGYLRGKGKLSVGEDVLVVGFPGVTLDQSISWMCIALEEEWSAAVEAFGVQGVRELSVSWRESWLGHWSV
jgi:hypothetical protein